MAFKNEFCALCNFLVNIDVWRKCFDNEIKLSGSDTELIMLLGVKDTLLEADDNNNGHRLTCATYDDVSNIH